MNVKALLTSAGINIGICVALFSLYSVLRKQPANVCVYFGKRFAQEQSRSDIFCFGRFVPSPRWIVNAWATPEEEILASAGLDAVVFLRLLIFSMRIFSITAVICTLSVLPMNYFGKEMVHLEIPSESLDVFTITNMAERSRWLWVHCLALYIISLAACVLLYFEYKSIARMRLEYITRSASNPSHFAVLVRGIPWSAEVSYSDSVEKYFTNYHAASYLSHQMVYHSGTVQKIMNDAHKMYKKLAEFRPIAIQQLCEPCRVRCNICGTMANSFKRLSLDPEQVEEKPTLVHVEVDSDKREKECAAAFVFFKTRYAAIVASQVLQSSNPMLWVTDLAPEPHDVYWSSLWIPYKQLWFRKIAIILAFIVFMIIFLVPVTLVQGLSQLEKLQKLLPFLRGILKGKLISQLVTGYLPSVILLLFMLTVPPVMILFSALEGNISRSGRKKSACCKILYFSIWNVFFANVFSGSVLSWIQVFSHPKDIPTELAKAVPAQASFFISYVLTSGWAGLACELIQPFALFCNICYRFALWRKEVPSNFTLSFPYHTETPRVLLFGLMGFTLSILAPLILPFLLIYFFLAYLIYRNQILNVYITKYESGGQFWPVAHNTIIFSLVLTQIIALGVFSLKLAPVAAGFTIPLVILTLLFNQYCKQRFYRVFKDISAEILIELDRQDEQCGKMEEIYHRLESAYCQSTLSPSQSCKTEESNHSENDGSSGNIKPALARPNLGAVPLSGLRQAMTWLTMLITMQEVK